MHIKPIYFILLLFIGYFLWACSTKESLDEETYSFGYEYFPVKVGHEVVYDIDSIVYDDFSGSVKKYTYQKKERITDSFYDASQRLYQRVERYYRKNDSDSWALSKALVHTLNTYTAEVQEDNQRIIRLVFPVQRSKSWNAYLYTGISGKRDFYYSATGGVYTYQSNKQLLNTITVTQQNDSNLIEKRLRREMYAPGVGMVFAQYDSIDTQFDGVGNPKVKGLSYIQKLHSYIP